MYHYSDKKYPCLVGIGLIKGLLEITLYLKWPLKEPRSQFPLHPPWCLSSSLALLPWCVLPRRLPPSESPPSYLASYREHNKRQWFFISFCIKVTILATAKRILERLVIQTSSSFVKIWLVCFPGSKANFLFFWHLVFYLESIGVL